MNPCCFLMPLEHTSCVIKVKTYVCPKQSSHTLSFVRVSTSLCLPSSTSVSVPMSSVSAAIWCDLAILSLVLFNDCVPWINLFLWEASSLCNHIWVLFHLDIIQKIFYTRSDWLLIPNSLLWIKSERWMTIRYSVPDKSSCRNLCPAQE